MKNNQLVFMLVGVFFLTTLATALFTYRFVNTARSLQEVSAKLDVINNTVSFLNQLGNETKQYSAKDPNINAVLQPANPAAVIPPPAK